MNEIFLNLGYGLNLLALTVRDVLLLRTVLLPAQVSFLTWGAISGIRTTVVWNLVFIAINLFHIIRILRERRPITLPPELSQIYEDSFSAMKPREFWLFWETGHNETTTDEPLVLQGEKPSKLMYLISGVAQVRQDGSTIATLKPGQFAAEMSFLSGQPASADVIAVGAVRIKSWDQSRLALLDKLNPQLSLKVQKVLSRDVMAKAQTRAQAT